MPRARIQRAIAALGMTAVAVTTHAQPEIHVPPVAFPTEEFLAANPGTVIFFDEGELTIFGGTEDDRRPLDLNGATIHVAQGPPPPDPDPTDDVPENFDNAVLGSGTQLRNGTMILYEGASTSPSSTYEGMTVINRGGRIRGFLRQRATEDLYVPIGVFFYPSGDVAFVDSVFVQEFGAITNADFVRSTLTIRGGIAGQINLFDGATISFDGPLDDLSGDELPPYLLPRIETYFRNGLNLNAVNAAITLEDKRLAGVALVGGTAILSSSDLVALRVWVRHAQRLINRSSAVCSQCRIALIRKGLPRSMRRSLASVQSARMATRV